jgi:hypothetical protein
MKVGDTVWVTRLGPKHPIIECKVSRIVGLGFIEVEGVDSYFDRYVDVFLTLPEAIADAKQRRDKEIAKHRVAIERLERMTFEEDV